MIYSIWIEDLDVNVNLTQVKGETLTQPNLRSQATLDINK